MYFKKSNVRQIEVIDGLHLISLSNFRNDNFNLPNDSEIFVISNWVKKPYKNELSTEIQREKIPFIKCHILIKIISFI